uniref:Uncharacterized protein n=1 Tax=Panagrolaimus davidi TaxID=227884 RepID=A0A914Q9J8_9BILA
MRQIVIFEFFKLFDLLKRTAAPIKLSDVSNNDEARKSSNIWKKSAKDLPLNYENDHIGKEEESKKGNSLNLKCSTLSLHIKAYENSVNADSFDGEKNDISKKKKITKQNLFDPISVIQNSFEFPRQQENDEIKEAETAYFKANQLLISPNSAQRHQTSRDAPALTAISETPEIDSKDAIPDESDQTVDVKLAFEFSKVPRKYVSAFKNITTEGALEMLKLLSKEQPESVKVGLK